MTYFSVMPTPYTTRGVSDFVAIIDGKCLCIEVKAQGKKPTEIQKYFGARVREAEGGYLVVSGSSKETKDNLDYNIKTLLGLF